MAPADQDKLYADLSAYLDGELPAERAREIERHLAESEEYRQAIEELRQAADALANLPRLRAPDELTAAMRRAMERRALLHEARPASGARSWRFLVQMTAAAAVVVGCILVGWQVSVREAGDFSLMPTLHEPTERVALTEQSIEQYAKLAPRDAAVALEHKDAPRLSGVGGRPAGAVETPKLAEPSLEEAVSLELGESGLPASASYGYQTPPAVAFGVPPELEVWIMPQSADQYTRAYALLTGGGLVKKTGEARLRAEAVVAEDGSSVAPEPVEFHWNAPLREVDAVIEDLKHQVPEHVYLAARPGEPTSGLMPLVWEPAKPASEDESLAVPRRGAPVTSLAGLRQAEVRRKGAVSRPAAVEEGKEDQPAVAAGAAADKLTEEDAGRAGKSRAAGRRGGARLGLARVRGGLVDRAAISATAPAAAPATPPPVRDQKSWERLGASGDAGTRLFFLTWQQASQATAAPHGEDIIGVRVRLLPPPTKPPATQPTSP